MRRCAAVWLSVLLLLGAAGPVLGETVLEKISRTGVLTAGTRGNAIPFAFINEKNEWIGFSIEERIGNMNDLRQRSLRPWVPPRTLAAPGAAATAIRLRAGSSPALRDRAAMSRGCPPSPWT